VDVTAERERERGLGKPGTLHCRSVNEEETAGVCRIGVINTTGFPCL